MHPTDDELVLHYYEEAGAEAIGEHLATCAACRERYQRLQRVMVTVSTSPVPAPAADYESIVWAAVQDKLQTARPGRADWVRGLVACPRWGWAAAGAAALFVATVWMWSLGDPADLPGAATITDAGSPASLRERVRLVALESHWQRAERLMVELVNAPADAVELTRAQADAEDLLAANRLYRHAALTEGDAAAASMLDDLERVLIELARTPAGQLASRLVVLRRHVESESVLFRLRVASAEARVVTVKIED